MEVSLFESCSCLTCVAQVARDIVDSPTRKTEVRVLNAEYYDKDGNPVASKLDGGRGPDKRVMTVFQKNDDEIEEHARHRRMERNYGFTWNPAPSEPDSSNVADDE